MTLLKRLFFKFSPILKFQIEEESMFPLLIPGQTVLVSRWGKMNRGDLVVLRNPENPKIFLIKRIQKSHDRKYFVVGENKTKSKDSRHFGWVEKKNIIGIVFYKARSQP